MSPRSTDRRQAGYTLIEMMWVVVVMAIGLAIMGPPVTREHGRIRLRRAVVQFEAAHSLARSVALEYGRIGVLRIDASKSTWWVESDTTVGIGSASAGLGSKPDEFGGANRFSGVTMTSDRSVLCFDSRGLPTTVDSCEEPDATVVFTKGSHSKTVQITALGRILR